MVAKALHSMVRVFDLERSLSFYREAFALELVERLEFADFTLAYVRNAENDFEVEFTWNHDQREPYEHGSGYGHLAVAVTDLDAEHERFDAAGFSPRKIVEMEHAGRPLARLFFVSDPDGYQIEVIERGGRFQ